MVSPFGCTPRKLSTHRHHRHHRQSRRWTSTSRNDHSAPDHCRGTFGNVLHPQHCSDGEITGAGSTGPGVDQGWQVHSGWYSVGARRADSSLPGKKDRSTRPFDGRTGNQVGTRSDWLDQFRH
jgi:hypothetical protein